jgi:acyl-CoA synthetase (AMP-forming)/AMP-acid ligase II
MPKAAVADGEYIRDLLTKTTWACATLRSLHWLAVDELERGNDGPVQAQEGYAGCGPVELYLIQYTSGATGVPRPVTVTAGSAAHNVRAARTAYALHTGSDVVSWLPQYHDCGLMFLLLTVVTGATCVLASPDAFVWRPRLWLELVAEFGATCTPVASFALPLVLRRGRSPRQVLELGSLQNLILVNEPIYKSVVEEFVEAFRRDGLRAAAVSPSYGLAENCTFVSTAWRSGCSDGGDFPSYKKLLPSARLSPPPPSEIEIVVVDEETGDLTEDGVEGEVWVSSASNASGYLGHPSATREAFCARVRSADVIALDGGRRRVHAHYVETAAYGATPDRLRGGCVAAFTTPSPLHADGEVAIVAELQKGKNAAGDHRGLCEGIRAAVWREEGVKVSRAVLVEAGEVPKTTSGKVRRGAARQKLLGGAVFEARYDYANDGTMPGVGGEEDMAVKSGRMTWLPPWGSLAVAFVCSHFSEQTLKARRQFICIHRRDAAYRIEF